MAEAGSQIDEATTADSTKEQQNGSDASLTTATSRTQRSPSPPQPQKLRKIVTGPLASAPSSLAASPRTSREPSPTRSTATRLPQPATSRLSRSRKNSQDQSPQRGPNAPYNIPDTPSAAAIQRALAAAGATRTTSPVASEFAGDVHRPSKPSRPSPVSRSNRLTSPPPALNAPKPNTQQSIKSDLEAPPTPSIVVNQATPKSASSFDDIQEEEEEDMLRAGIRSPVRKGSNKSPLEAVQESAGPETPALEGKIRPPLSREASLNRAATMAEFVGDERSAKGAGAPVESGNESAGGKSSKSNNAVERSSEVGKQPTPQSATKHPSLNPRTSYTQLSSTKNKVPGEGSARNMTVETETVSSIPQMSMGPAAENRTGTAKGDGASVRLKPSTETIRPKKEKKKTVRKTPSITTGTASSKADIFEAKLKSAVDEANSSDSEETFVYESNPPEPVTRSQHRYHSRTPSMTSIASQGEPFRNRFRSEGNGSLVGKKSMKFANSSKNMNAYNGDGDDASSAGTPVSARPNPGNGSQQYPRHIGRHGRTPGHLSLFDDNAPFQQTSKSLRKGLAGSLSRRASPHPYTPRSPLLRSAKSVGGVPYDLEADDERTPLMSARTPRGPRRRTYPMDDDYYYGEPQTGFWNNMGKGLLLGSLVLVLIILIVFALVLCSKPLESVYVKEITNVLASDQEIIFDMKVHAINPNLVALQVSDLDVLIHAKSKYVGTSKYWREHGQVLGVERQIDNSEPSSNLMSASGQEFRANEGVDEGTDPIDMDPHVMLLGSIFHFDAPLNFEASPFKRRYSSSVGEVRLNKPGNSSEAGGSDRWEAVIQHDFELIVRGVIKYSLPVSSKIRTAAISGRTLVHPEDPVDPEKPGDDDRKGNHTAQGDVGIS